MSSYCGKSFLFFLTFFCVFLSLYPPHCPKREREKKVPKERNKERKEGRNKKKSIFFFFFFSILLLLLVLFSPLSLYANSSIPLHRDSSA